MAYPGIRYTQNSFTIKQTKSIFVIINIYGEYIMATKAKLAKKIEEVVKPYCDSKWCLLKEMLVCSHTDPRLFIQLKCVEHFKFEESEKAGKDIGWDVAHCEWVARGHAKSFAEHYNEDLTAEQVYEKVINSSKK